MEDIEKSTTRLHLLSRWNTTVMLPIDRNVKSAHYPTPKRLIYKHGTPLTPYIFEQHISLSIKRDQKNDIKTMKEKSFFDFSKGSLEPSFSGQLDLSGFPSKVKVQIGIIN